MNKAQGLDGDGAPRNPEKERAEFFAQVSHDLKTPLNAVIGFTSVLLYSAKPFCGEQSQQLNLIYMSARQLLERLEALVEFFRLQAEIVPGEVQWCDLEALGAQSLERMQGEAEKKAIALRFVNEVGPGRIQVNLSLLSRVLQELLSNAVRATKQGQVLLAVSQGAPTGNPQESVCFAVTDTGCGLRLEETRRLSELLQPDPGEPASSGYRGLGLGLALARECAIRLGGRLTLSATEGQGCRFELALDLPAEGVQKT